MTSAPAVLLRSADVISDAADAVEEVDADTLFSLLSTGRRRDAIVALAGVQDDPETDALTMRQLAARISDEVEPEHYDDLDGLDGDRETAVRRAMVTLQQNHIPRLESAGLVETDDEGKHAVTLLKVRPVADLEPIAEAIVRVTDICTTARERARDQHGRARA